MAERAHRPSIVRPRREPPPPLAPEERSHVMHVTEHALDRYLEHDPAASRRDLLLAVAHGVGLTREMAASLLGRPLRNGCTDCYVLAASRRGVFVLRMEDSVVVTYLRFGPTQEAFARRHWPLPGEESHG